MDDFGETPEDYGGGGGGGETGISWGDSGDGGEWAETGGFGGCPDGRTPSAETCASSADEDCNGVDCALWSQGFRVISPVSRIKTDVYGNVYVFGQSGSMADFGAGPLAAAGGNDLLVAKFDALGSHLWSRRFGDAGDQLAADLAIDAGGNVLLGGSFIGSLDFGKGVSITASSNLHKDAFVAKLDTHGTAVWAQRFGDSSADQIVRALGTTSNGDVVVAGDFSGTVNLGGASMTAAGASPTTDIFLGQLAAADGAHVWSTQFGDAGWQEASDLGVDAAGNITLTGTMTGVVDFGGSRLSANGTDIYIARFGATGTSRCTALLDSGDGDYPLSIGVDPGGNAIVAGYNAGSLDLGGGPLTSVGAQDVFVTKRNRLCQEVWSRSFGSEGNEYAADLAITAAGDVYLTMSTQGPIDMGGGPLQAFGNADAVIAKYDGSGNHVWSRLFGDPYQQDFPHVATAGVTAVVSFTNTGIVDLGYGETLSGLVLGAFAP